MGQSHQVSDEDYGGPMIPQPVLGSLMEIRMWPREVYRDGQMVTLKEVKVYANRVALQWLAYQCLHLAYAAKELENDLHCHLDLYACPTGVPEWDVSVTLELSDNKHIRQLRREAGRCPWCGRDASVAQSGRCFHCGKVLVEDHPGE